MSEQVTNSGKTFFIVVKDGGQMFATRRHETDTAAFDEAERLCRKENARFIVLRAVAVVAQSEPPVRWENYE